MNPFIQFETHYGQQVGVEETSQGYLYHIVTDELAYTSKQHYHDPSFALCEGVAKAEQMALWQLGFNSYHEGEKFPDSASPDFRAGWKEAQEVSFELNALKRLREKVSEQRERASRGEPISVEDIQELIDELVDFGLPEATILSIIRKSTLEIEFE